MHEGFDGLILESIRVPLIEIGFAINPLDPSESESPKELEPAPADIRFPTLERELP
ncbi:MAG: hypothetical protein WBL19_00800 [Minisyncoccia bacterium]